MSTNTQPRTPIETGRHVYPLGAHVRPNEYIVSGERIACPPYQGVILECIDRKDQFGSPIYSYIFRADAFYKKPYRRWVKCDITFKPKNYSAFWHVNTAIPEEKIYEK